MPLGGITIGGGAPVSVQSMTKTHTEDVEATLDQIRELADIGCEIIRCAVPNRRAVPALEQIKASSLLPVVADIHFSADLALRALETGVDGVRVNPGTIKDIERLDDVFAQAGERGIKVRVGMNSGSVRARSGLSVSPEASRHDVAELMVEDALKACRRAEEAGCANLVVSLKASDVPSTIRAYRMAADRCDYPFHLGVTAAGPMESSVIKSAVGIGTLLAEGIGDTIRVSITGPPHEEVRVAYRILESLGLRRPEGPEIISCPTCGRCEIDLRSLVAEVKDRLRDFNEPIKVAVMGCAVNGPGEAAECDVGVAGGREFGYIFCKGKKIEKRPAEELTDALMEQIEKLE